MTYYELKLYTYNRKKPLCTALFQSKATLDDFITSLSSDSEIIKLGEIVFKRKDFEYAEIKEKTIKHR